MNCNENGKREKILISETKSLNLSIEEIISIENTMQKSKMEIKYDDETSDSESDDIPLSIIDQIDIGLGKYYHQHNRTDYYNELGEGLFKLHIFCVLCIVCI